MKILKNRKFLIYFAIFLVILTTIYVVYKKNQIKMTVKPVRIDNTIIISEIAETEKEQIKGLSDRKSLGEYAGMLFVFDKEDKHNIWMKDMNFSIDIAWLDKNKKIIYIMQNVSPDTYPQSFSSPTNSLYVLETNAGFFEKRNIEVGDSVNF